MVEVKTIFYFSKIEEGDKCGAVNMDSGYV